MTSIEEKDGENKSMESEGQVSTGESGGSAGAESGARARKERVLHTRIPEVLETELKALASNLRVPVSNLVRTILQDALEAAELVGRAAEHELRGAADRLARNRERMHGAAASKGAELGQAAARKEEPESPPAAAPPLLEGVIGYQSFILAQETHCARCHQALAVGETAYLGVRDQPGPRVIIGPECLPGASPKSETAA